MLIRIATVEGPVHFDVVMERLREHYDIARARQPSRDQVSRVIGGLAKAKSVEVDRERAGSTRAGSQPSDELFLSFPGSLAEPRRQSAGDVRRTQDRRDLASRDLQGCGLGRARRLRCEEGRPHSRDSTPIRIRPHGLGNLGAN